MRQTIETAPRDGTIIILEDDASGTYDVASWSTEAGRWVGENGDPSKISPTYWHQRHGDYQYFLQGNDHQPRRSKVFPIMAVSLLVMGLTCLYFEVFDALYLEVFHSEAIVPSQDPHKANLALRQRTDASITVGAGTRAEQAVEALPSEARQSVIGRPELAGTVLTKESIDRQFQADVAVSAPSIEEGQRTSTVLSAETASKRQELTAIAEQHRQPIQQAIEEERAGSAALPSELATAEREVEAQQRRSINEAAQLAHTEAAKSEQLNEEKAKEMAALAMEAAAARQELAAIAEQYRQKLEEERARSAALAIELATAQRDMETNTTQSLMAIDNSTAQKQAAEASIAELRQSQQQERQRAETLSNELGEVRREREALAIVARQKEDEVAQLKRATEVATAELEQSLRRQRDKVQELEGELAQIRQDTDPSIAALRKANGEEAPTHVGTVTSNLGGTMRRQQSGETALNHRIEDAKAELRPSLHQKRGHPEGITPNAETARKPAGTAATEQPTLTVPNRSEAAELLARAEALADQGDIRAARIVLERAMEAVAVAGIHDPNVPPTGKVRAPVGEAAKARYHYVMPHGGGTRGPKERSRVLAIGHGERKPAGWFGRESEDR
jgi:hypothetical protein